MKIVLIRHGKVNYPPLAIISAASFSNWVTAYNNNELDKSSTPTDEVLDIVSKTKAVVCSQLIRSHHSAKELGVKNVTYSNSIFNEAGLPAANWMFPPLSVRIWAILFRLLWLVGYSKNSDGIFNRMLANRLLEAGWVGPKKPSSEYWGFGVYEK